MNTINSVNLTPIFQALIGLLGMLITYKLIPWLKEKTTNEQRIKIEAAVKTAVFAAEQAYGAGKGKEKMDYAMKLLHDNGFDVDPAVVDAAVMQFFNLSRKDHIINKPEIEKPAE